MSDQVGELEELKRYANHIEQRYQEVAESEDKANRKVLELLDEVQSLTEENQALLMQRDFTSSQEEGIDEVDSNEEISQRLLQEVM